MASEAMHKYNECSSEGDKEQEESELFGQLLEVPPECKRVSSADADLSSKSDCSIKRERFSRPLSEDFSKEKEKSGFQQDLRERRESYPDFITVQILNKPISDGSSEENSPRKNKLSRRGLSLIEDSSQFLESVEFNQFERWLLLIGCSLCNAIVPCWMTVDIQCEGITKSAWRTFILSIFLIPFVMNEQKGATSGEETLWQLVRYSSIRKIYVYSLNYSIWVAFGVLAVRLTARSHSFCFLRMNFFFVTIYKIFRKHECHDGEIGGLLLVAIGVLMMLWDSVSLPVGQIPNIYYLSRLWWERLLGDLCSIVGCLVLLFLQSKNEMPKGPRFSILLIYNLCVTVNLVVLGYFLGGAEFSLDPKIGVFGLFTSTNFVGVFYVSIMLGVNLVIANVLVDQIFSQVIRKIASCFEIVITTSFYHMFSIEQLSGGMSSLGLCFLVPGMMMIVGGQSSLQKLEMTINSEIYTSQKVVINNYNQLTQIILKPMPHLGGVDLPVASNRNTTKSHHYLQTIDETEDLGSDGNNNTHTSLKGKRQ